MNHAEPIRHTLTVPGSPDRVFKLFTEDMGAWWPLESYSRAVSEFAHENVRALRLTFDPRLGGSILEHLSDGRMLPWAEVTDWDPPHRVVLAWRPHSAPEPPTELEVRFSEQGTDTVVQLEHRGWERLSDDFRAGLYDVYVRGWVTTLERYAEVANRNLA
jgi:uncharacterized protein YndB with AHSA1/START domain